MLGLSDVERSSYQVLLEWYRARELHHDVENDAQEAERRLDNSAIPKSPTYHDVLAELQSLEFHNPRKSRFRIGKHATDLDSQRRKAVFFAACERMASAYLGQNLPTRNTLLTTQNTLTTASLPFYGTSVIPKIPTKDDAPYYLYDTSVGEVRRVEDLISAGDSVPEYVAICHSWVRRQDDVAPKVQVASVPRKVPENTKFGVENLPAMLSALPWKYIWIDLLTIPQGSVFDLDNELLQRKDSQIRSVSSIFRKASKVVAWFDDIPAWIALPSALRYLTLQYLIKSTRTGMDKLAITSLLPEADTIADNPLELLSIKHGPTREAPATNVWEPNAWFTSPWSLQELILRPDMLLYNGNWEILEISKGIPVTMNTIAAFLSVVMETGKTNAPAPLSVQELFQIFENAGLEHLLEITEDTSVNFFRQIKGVSPQDDKGYPCIVPKGNSDGSENPHKLPKEGEIWISETGRA